MELDDSYLVGYHSQYESSSTKDLSADNGFQKYKAIEVNDFERDSSRLTRRIDCRGYVVVNKL